MKIDIEISGSEVAAFGWVSVWVTFMWLIALAIMANTVWLN